MEKKHRQHYSLAGFSEDFIKKKRAKKIKEEISDSRLWECKECGNGGGHEAWSYETMVQKGTPVCPSCAYDMSLVHESK